MGTLTTPSIISTWASSTWKDAKQDYNEHLS
jgi:hypothetical protein